jgi:hypothetical protein
VSLLGRTLKVSPNDLFVTLNCFAPTLRIAGSRFSPLLYIAAVTCFLPFTAILARYYDSALLHCVISFLVEGSFIFLDKS